MQKYRYTYPQNGWKDQLIERSYKEYDGTEVVERFEYDSLGNPTIYRNKSLTWQGRRLKQLDDTAFTYDVNGIRTSKVHNSILTKYIYDGNNLVAEQRGSEWIYYLYGVDGVAGFRYNNETYLYRKNVQGDVTHIYRQEGDYTLTLVAQYVYDAWGNYDILQDKDGIAMLNPFRYRSYYFDTETKLYYLQTRYYDPELGRFISADSIEYLDPETLGGLNLYAYCGNNTVMAVDPEGKEKRKWWEWLIFGVVTAITLAVAIVVSVVSFGALSPMAALVLNVVTAASFAYLTGVAVYSVDTLVNNKPFDPIQALKVGGESALIAGTTVLFGGILGEVGALVGSEIGYGIGSTIGNIFLSNVISSSVAAGEFIGSTLGIITGSVIGLSMTDTIFGREIDWWENIKKSITDFISDSLKNLLDLIRKGQK